MIERFKHRGLRRLFERDEHGRVAAQDVDKIKRILAALSRAGRPENMNLPGFRLHPLKGDMKGHWAVTVRANWRVTFKMEKGNAYDVDLTDYH
jgi:proteic killer suppression protein